MWQWLTTVLGQYSNLACLQSRAKVIYCIIVLGRVLDKLGFKPALEDSDMVDAFKPEDKEIDSAKAEAETLEQAEEGLR